MKPSILAFLCLSPSLVAADPVATVTSTPGLVAFWDFVYVVKLVV